MNSEDRQTESLDCPPRKLRILGKADGFSQDPDVVRLTLLVIFYLEYRVQGKDNSCKHTTHCLLEYRTFMAKNYT